MNNLAKSFGYILCFGYYYGGFWSVDQPDAYSYGFMYYKKGGFARTGVRNLHKVLRRPVTAPPKGSTQAAGKLEDGSKLLGTAPRRFLDEFGMTPNRGGGALGAKVVRNTIWGWCSTPSEQLVLS